MLCIATLCIDKGVRRLAADSIDKELLKGTIPFMVLRLIGEKDMYGYQIIRLLSGLSGDLFLFKEGTLYPILHNLEKEGFISSYWQESSVGRKRKYYRITEDGRKQLEMKFREWERFKTAVDLVLTKEVPEDED